MIKWCDMLKMRRRVVYVGNLFIYGDIFRESLSFIMKLELLTPLLGLHIKNITPCCFFIHLLLLYFCTVFGVVLVGEKCTKDFGVELCEVLFKWLFDGFEGIVNVFLAFNDHISLYKHDISLHLLVRSLEVHFHDGVWRSEGVVDINDYVGYGTVCIFKELFHFIIKEPKSSMKTFECGLRVIHQLILQYNLYTIGLRQWNVSFAFMTEVILLLRGRKNV